MEKSYVLVFLSLFVAQGNQCGAAITEKKVVFFINGTEDAFNIKGPFGVKERFVPQVRLDKDNVDVAEFEASNNDLFKIQFMPFGSRFSKVHVVKEFTTKFPKSFTALVFTKTVEEDQGGEPQTTYHVFKADAFTETKLIDPKSF